MRVRFTGLYSYVPALDPRVTIVYNPRGGPNKDGRYTVKRECGEAAIAAGAAVADEPAQEAADDAEAAPEA